jgi:hypothetical protein
MAVMVAAIVLGSATMAVRYVGVNPFERSVIRHVDNAQESAVLALAEKLDYGTILSTPRFNNATGEPRCRFIDKQAIDFLYDRVGELQSRGPPNRASMSYEADVYPVDRLRVIFSPGHSPRFNFSFEPGSRSFWGFMDEDDDSRIAFWNGTAYLILDATSVLRLDNATTGGSLVVMKLIYSKGTSTYNMERSEARQYVYFDPGGNATRIAFERHDGNVEW